MPRVPQVFSSPDAANVQTTPVRAPQDFGGGLGYLKEGLNDLGHAAKTYAHTQSVLADEQTKIDAAVAMGELERQAADADIQRKQDTTIRPEDYSRRVDEDLAEIRKGVGRSIQNQKAKLLFDRTSERFVTEQSIKGKYDGLELAHSAVKSGVDILLKSDSNRAVFGATPEEQTQGVQDGLGRIDDLLKKRILTPDQARVKNEQFLESVEIGRIRKDFLTPKLRLGIIASLRRGERTNISPEKQLELADQLENNELAEDKRRKAEIKEAEKEVRDTSDRLVIDLTVSGRFADARKMLSSPGVARLFEGPRYEALHNMITVQENKGTPSDPAIYTQMTLDTYSITTDPKDVLGRAQGYLITGALNRENYKELAAHLETRIGKKAEGDPILAKRHTDAQHQIQEALRVTGPAAALLNTQAQALYVLALQDLSRSSSYLGRGDEDPSAWIERRSAFYVGQLQVAANQQTQILRQQMRLGDGSKFVPSGNYFADAQRLQAQQGTFKTAADFWDQVRGLRDLYALEQEMARARGITNPGAPQPSIQTGPESPGSPAAPSGQKSSPSAPKPPASGGGGTVRGRSQ